MAAIFAIAAFALNAQMPCGTTQAVKKALQNNPAALQRQQELEDFTQSYVPSGERAVKIIPVVVHIIHNYGPENISKAQVVDAIRILNEDFQLLNADTTQIIAPFKSRKGAPNFEFRLAQKDPSGNCTDGITRTVSELTFNGDDNVKDLISWPTNKYFNIWVIDKISFEAGGYAYFPGTAPLSEYEGVVVVNTQFGSIGESGGSNFSKRTLTHEAGHYFNLAHPWGGNNDCGSGTCDTDDVTDTPTTEGTCQNCDLTQATCGTLANVQNYMDYATCSVMFTTGQSTRMLAAANSNIGDRNNLWKTANLIATGTNDGYSAVCKPVADFAYSKPAVCGGNEVQFTDISYNASVDNSWVWNWDFSGPTNFSSSQQNPSVVFTTPGVYNVTLTVTNSAGNSTITRSQLITVKSSQGVFNTPFSEGVENAQFPTNTANTDLNWLIESPTLTSWARTTATAYTGSASLKIAGSAFTQGSQHNLISPAIDVSNTQANPLTVSFKVAYRYDGSNADVLKLYVSKDCGENWIARYTKSGQALGTVSNGTASFTPNGVADWRTENVNINPVAGQEGVLLRFELIAAGGGGNLYIDDINIAGNPTNIAEQTTKGIEFTIYPNPITNQSQLAISGLQQGKATITLFDIAGRQLAAQTVALQSDNTFIISLTDIVGGVPLPSGIYNIRLQQGTAIINKRLVVSQ